MAFFSGVNLDNCAKKLENALNFVSIAALLQACGNGFTSAYVRKSRRTRREPAGER